MQIYNKEYFINKFSTIPEDKWCIICFKDKKGRSCALGHCGYDAKEINEECKSLIDLLSPLISEPFRNEVVSRINDGIGEFRDYGITPKERILNALNKI